MANIISVNNPYIAATNSFEAIWRMTRVMKKAGWTVVSTGNGSTKVATATNNTDQWGNNADPLLDTYPTSFTTLLPWIVMRGPSTLKIPIVVAPTGAPLRGEKITQNSAEGELLGYTFDTASSSGWMVVAPRVGTFNSVNTINCSISSATFTPSGTITTFVREVMIAKGSVSDASTGYIFYICADQSAESAQLYSTIATSTGCTGSVAPACGGTGNTLPALGIVVRGTGGSYPGSVYLMAQYSSGYIGNYHVACANAIGSTGVSPDGSFYCIGSNSNGGTVLAGFSFTKVDDSDPGDCDPYVFIHTNSAVPASWSRTTSIGSGGNQFPLLTSNLLNTNYTMGVGYQARGCPVTTRDIAVGYFGAVNSANGSSQCVIFNYPSTFRTLNHPATNPPLTREGLIIWCGGNVPNSIKHYKGRARWINIYSQGNCLDTFDNKKFICVNAYSSNTAAVSIGPWDGTTVPIS